MIYFCMTKLCNTCDTYKTEDEFPASVWQYPTHYKKTCRACSREQARASHLPKKGFIYIIMNNAWPDWCKVGLTTTAPEQRLQSYQTGSPFRDYYIRYSKESLDVARDEANIHDKLKALGYESSAEWFKVDAQIIIELL